MVGEVEELRQPREGDYPEFNGKGDHVGNWLCRQWRALRTYVRFTDTPTIVTKAIQINKWYNYFVAIGVNFGYLITPYASKTEYLGDVAIHLLQARTKFDSSTPVKAFMGVINTVRIITIYRNGLNQNSTIPTTLNYGDIVNHVINIALLVASFVALIMNREKREDDRLVRQRRIENM